MADTHKGRTIMLGLIGMIIAGAIIGALARLIMRGHQNISALWTVILGAVGAFVGGGIASFFGVADTAGIDWIRWILSIIAAIVAISIYLSVTKKN
ncbi:transglycosylase associated protein [Rothia dentocariosa ATCC 17931]|nr:transglycosylase associated protein [Rothia dentocariosa ATCC 17931]